MTTPAIEKAMNTPPIMVAGATVLGYSLPEIAAFVTIVYTLLLIYFRLRREYQLWRQGRAATPDHHDDDEGDDGDAPRGA